MAKITMNKASAAPDAPSANKVALYPLGNNIVLKREDGSTSILNIDGNTTSNLTEGSNLYYTNARVDARIAAKQALNHVRVAKSGGDFTSIAAAVDSITTASSTNLYVISVGPGIYVEPQIDVPSWVYIVGMSMEGVIVKPLTTTQHVFTMTANVALSYLSIMDAGTGFAGIFCSDAGDYGILHKLTVRYCDYGVIAQTTPTGVDSYLYLEYVDTSDCITGGMNVISDGFVSFVQVENFYVINVDQTPAYGVLVDGPDAQLVCQAYGFEGLNGTGSAIRVVNGATLDAKGGTFRNWDTGIKVEASGTAPRLLLAGVLFDANTTYNINVLNGGTTGHFTGYTEYSKTSIHADATFFVTNKDARRITVAKKGGDFTSLKAAVDSISGASSTNTYEISVGPGVFVEDTIQCKQFVYITGSGDFITEIQASGVNQHVFLGADNSAIQRMKIAGSTGSGYACVYHVGNGTLVPFLVRECAFGNTDICVKAHGTSVPPVLQIDSCRMGGQFNFTEGIVLTNTSSMPVQCLVQNHVFQDIVTPYCTNFARAEGAGVSLILSGCNLRGGVATGSAVTLSNGAELRALGVSIRGFAAGIKTLNVGSAPNIIAHSISIAGCTMDLVVEHPGTTGSFSGSLDSTKVSIDSSAPITPFYADSVLGGVAITGKLSFGANHAQLVDIGPLVSFGPAMGVITGGELTDGGGLSLSIAAGNGYLRTTGDVLKKYAWSGQSLTLTASVVSYIYFNESGTLSAASTIPSSVNNIILGRVITTASAIEFIDSTPVIASNTGNLLGQFNRFAVGALYRSGSVVTENGTRGLNVSGGEYRFSTNKFLPSGGTGVSFSTYRINSGGGYIRATGVTTVDNTQYDNAGTLTNLTATYYMKHALYIVGHGALEKYFLVIAQAQYASLVEAEDAPLPTPPSYFTEGVVSIASIVVRQGTANIIQFRDERPQINKASSGVSASSTHANLLGLSADDHTQYLLASGGRAMAGTLDMGTNPITNVGLVDGVDISAHQSRHLPNGSDALATAAPTANLTGDTTNSVGVQNSLARSDHSHAISTGAPSSLTPALSNAAGTSASLARADHIHNIPVAAPSSTGLANAAGSASSFARSDHVHALALPTKNAGTQIIASTASLNFSTGLTASVDGSNNVTVVSNAKTQQEVNATVTSTTTSASFVDMNSMTLTATAAGPALIVFGASVTNSNANRDITITLNVAGSQIVSTQRYVRNVTGGYAQTMSVHTVRTLAVNDIVKVQWSTSSNTASVYERTLSIVYL